MRRSWLIVWAIGLSASPATAGLVGGAAPTSAFDPAVALAAIDRHLAEIDSEVHSDRAEQSQMGERLSAAHRRLLVHARAFYKLTRAGLMPVGGGFRALVTHAMHVERARRLVTVDLGTERQLASRADELGRVLDRLSRDRSGLASQREAIEAARMALQDDTRRQAAFDRAFETSAAAGADYVAVYGGASGILGGAPPSGFLGARGKLLFPVIGPAEVHPARRQGTDGPGLEIHAPAGAVVRAAFAGRVAFADRYGPYGQIVILDHGNHCFTVSGNLGRIDVKTGDDVGAGERVGTVGDDGAGPMLYFEVRQGSQTVAPGPWLGL